MPGQRAAAVTSGIAGRWEPLHGRPDRHLAGPRSIARRQDPPGDVARVAGNPHRGWADRLRQQGRPHRQFMAGAGSGWRSDRSEEAQISVARATIAAAVRR